MQDSVISPEEKVKQAELAAQQSREQFEEALGQLVDRVDETATTAKKVIEVATAPSALVKETVSHARELIEPGIDNLTRETKQIVKKVVENVRSNPRPYIIGASAFCLGALVLFYVFRSEKNKFDTLN